MHKTVWITSLTKDEEKTAALFNTVQGYGLDAAGHFWIDDPDKLGWAGAAEELLKPDTTVWLITGETEDFAKDSIRRELSLPAALLAARRGHGFPIVISPFAGEALPTDLPGPFKGAEVCAPDALGPKLAAKSNIPWKPAPAGYRLEPHPMDGLGLWFEVGPAEGRTWKGVVFGTCGAETEAHGVGPAGALPERCTLEYPFTGMKMESGGREYAAGGASNTLTDRDAYYVKVSNSPAALLFGELPGGGEAELFSLVLS